MQILVFIFIAIVSFNVSAVNHALIIGVGDYPGNSHDLDGPEYDVLALRRAVQENWNIEEKNITTLINEQGTQSAIIENILALYSRVKPKDNVFIYFSGHGTSKYDHKSDLPLPDQSGAFVPYDAVAYIDNKNEYIKKLIIGRRDLKPLLTEFDNADIKALVVMDACFSGEAVRSGLGLPKRNIDPSLSSSREDVGSFGQGDVKRLPYPYKNIFFISASGEREPANDISWSKVDIYNTVDGKPHGAFTDSFLRVIKGERHGDMDLDSKITFGELYAAIKMHMDEKGYAHTPMRRPSLPEEHNNLSSHSFFGMHKQNVKPPIFTVDASRVSNLEQELSSFNIASSIKNPNILVVPNNEGFKLVTSSQDEILNMPRATLADLKQMIVNQQLIHNWVFGPVKNHFNAYSEITGGKIGEQVRGSVLMDGERLGLVARPSQDSYLLIFNITSDATVNLIYPLNKTEIKKKPKNENFKLADLGTVQAPEGRDYVFFIWVEDWPKAWNKLVNGEHSFPLNSSKADLIYDVLQNDAVKKAKDYFSFYTKI